MKALAVLLALGAVYIQGSLLVDDFSSGLIGSNELVILAGDPATGPHIVVGYQTGIMLGGERDIEIEGEAANINNALADAKVTVGGTCAGSTDNNVFARWLYQYDGLDASMTLNNGGTLINSGAVCPYSNDPFFRIHISATDQCHFQDFTICDTGNFCDTVTKKIAFLDLGPGSCFGTPNPDASIDVEYLVSEFTGVNLNALSSVEVEVDALRANPIEALDYVWDNFGFCCCHDATDCDDGNPTTTDECFDACTCVHLVDTEPPTDFPTEAPTQAPTENPTEAPTTAPTENPTDPPTDPPTDQPTEAPTQAPTDAPTEGPTENLTCPAGICEEEAKSPICFPDNDGHLNRICVHNDDLLDYIANGGFNPDDRPGVDCDCNFLFAPTEAPTPEPEIETNPPTDPPTQQPTQPPSEPPTEPPTDPPTETRNGFIGDQVFDDLNDNGIQDPGEGGIFGVMVYLIDDLNGDGVFQVVEPVIAQDMTNIDGEYFFVNLLTDRDYIVVVDDEEGVLGDMEETTSLLTPAAPGGDLEIVFGPSVRGSTGVYLADTGPGSIRDNIDYGFVEPVEEVEICLDVVPDDPSKNFRCIIDSNYNVDMGIVDLTDVAQYYDLFPLGSYYDVFSIGESIWYDCWCHAHCPWGSEHDHMFVPEFLTEQSWFYDNILHLTVAIPNKFDLGTNFYFQDALGNTIPVGDCDTNLIEFCPFWTSAASQNSTESFFRHNCYTAYYSDIPLSLLTPFYNTHEDGSSADPGGWMVTYYGLLVSVSGQDLGDDIRGVPETYTQRSNYKWAITFPLQVEAHVEDIRVYDEVNKVDNVISSAVFVEDFEWGFSWGMYNIWGEASIRTSVQWPFRLDVETVAARTNPNLDVFVQNVDDTQCQDPGITEYGDAAWVASAVANELSGGAYVPEECIQVFELRIEILDESVCRLDDYYDMGFDVECQASYADNCPLDERYDAPLMCEFWLSTENFCDMFEREITVTAEMDSYSCIERNCACEEENFIESFINQNDEVAVETVYFELVVDDASEPLEASELRKLDVDVVCDQPPVNVMTEIYNRFWPGSGWIADIDGSVDNSPNTIDQCLDGTSQNTINFAFDLPPDFFNVPYDDSCQLSVWAVVDLWYRGVERPDGLTAGGKKLLESNDEEIFSYGESRSITITHQLLVSDGTQVQVRVDPAPARAAAAHLAPALVSLLVLVGLILV